MPMPTTFYAALKVIQAPFSFSPDEGYGNHLTLMYSKLEHGNLSETIQTDNNIRVNAIVEEVQYWEHVDLTVLVVYSPYIQDRHNYYCQLGFQYDHPFTPHITVAKGNRVKHFCHMVQQYIVLGDEYIKFK